MQSRTIARCTIERVDIPVRLKRCGSSWQNSAREPRGRAPIMSRNRWSDGPRATLASATISTGTKRSSNLVLLRIAALFLVLHQLLVSPVEAANTTEPRLAKLVKIFSKPGAFSQMDEIFGEQEPIGTSSSSCPDGEEGLECRRAEARRSVDCPRGDCYCYNCSKAGPELWASCCRESLKCCSHLAAACRTCDQPYLYPFCAKHFKKCLAQLNDKKTV